ncbi:MAG: tetratricopeptide repeat protein [Armatimonadetes bacterium]|nr:tetratricopeptide repeat protein [Armatimonadota bacterium]
MGDMPAGTVTFLFTDIEGSTLLWQDQPGAMGRALERHDMILRSCIEDRGGYVFTTVGDAFCAAFQSAGAAVNAAIAVQLALKEEEWPQEAAIRVRAALHTAEAICRDGDYFGVELSRVGRLLSAGHGGQILVSGATKEMVQDHLPADTALRPMGAHRLKDLARPADVFQLEHKDLEGEFPPLDTLDNLPNNLPHQLTSFVGRESELEEIRSLTEKTRLLTLTGVGGTGKTRLALQFAADQTKEFKNGVWFVELAAISDPNLVANEVATALSIKEEPGESMADTLVARLAAKEMLIVLDNCEHLLAACTDLCAHLLKSCQGLHILATSREALSIGGELTYHVPSLQIPDLDTAAEEMENFESVRLFVERALFAQPSFIINETNAPAVAAVCSRLDGIPLAIELAAARMRSMTAQDVDDRLDQKFRLLTGGAKSALKRHQTLQGLIDWSYDLLDEREKALLQRLSVFRGGWAAESAEIVCSDDIVAEYDVLDLLSSLVDKSLVLSEDTGGHARYWMLETVRDYAAEKLAQEDIPVSWRDRHLDHFMLMAEEGEPELTSKGQQEWCDRFDEEHDNLRAALDWSLIDPQRAESGLRTASALSWFWLIRGYSAEGLARFQAALSSNPGDHGIKAKALYSAGNLAYRQSDFAKAVELFEQALVLYRKLGDKSGEASALSGLGSVALYRMEFDDARRLSGQSLALFRELGHKLGTAEVLRILGSVATHVGDSDKARASMEESLAIHREFGHQTGVALILGNLGVEAYSAGNLEAARAYYEESLELSRKLRSRTGTATSVSNLGNVACGQGEFSDARSYLSEGIEICMDIGDKRIAAYALEYSVLLLASEKKYGDAARLVGACEALRKQIEAPLAPHERADLENHIAEAREAFGDDDAFDAWVKEGREMSLDDAVELAVSESDAPIE